MISIIPYIRDKTFYFRTFLHLKEKEHNYTMKEIHANINL